jgi:hypothetical protein
MSVSTLPPVTFSGAKGPDVRLVNARTSASEALLPPSKGPKPVIRTVMMAAS